MVTFRKRKNFSCEPYGLFYNTDNRNHPPWQGQQFDSDKSQESTPKGKRQTMVYFLSNPSPALGIQLSCDLEAPKRNLFFSVYGQSCVPRKDDSEHLSFLKCFGFWKPF